MNELVKCPGCGKFFELKDPRRKYCTGKCQRTNKYKRARKKKIGSIFCMEPPAIAELDANPFLSGEIKTDYAGNADVWVGY